MFRIFLYCCEKCWYFTFRYKKLSPFSHFRYNIILRTRYHFLLFLQHWDVILGLARILGNRIEYSFLVIIMSLWMLKSVNSPFIIRFLRRFYHISYRDFVLPHWNVQTLRNRIRGLLEVQRVSHLGASSKNRGHKNSFFYWRISICQSRGGSVRLKSIIRLRRDLGSKVCV